MEVEHVSPHQLEALGCILKLVKIQNAAIDSIKKDVKCKGPGCFLFAIWNNLQPDQLLLLCRSPHIIRKLKEAGFDCDPRSLYDEESSAFDYATENWNAEYLRRLYDYMSNFYGCFKIIVNNVDENMLKNFEEIKITLEKIKSKLSYSITDNTKKECLEKCDEFLKFNDYKLRMAQKFIDMSSSVTTSDKFRRNVISCILHCYNDFFNFSRIADDPVKHFFDYVAYSEYYELLDNFTCLQFFDNVLYIKEKLDQSSLNECSELEDAFFILALCNRTYFKRLQADCKDIQEGKYNVLIFLPVSFRMLLKCKMTDFQKMLCEIPFTANQNSKRQSILGSFSEIKDELLVTRLKTYLKIASEMEFENKSLKSVLVIERILQVIGESLRTRSRERIVVPDLLHSCLPEDVVSSLAKVRNDFLSHYRANSIQGRREIETNVSFFRNLHEEVRLIDEAFKPVCNTQEFKTEQCLIEFGKDAAKCFAIKYLNDQEQANLNKYSNEQTEQNANGCSIKGGVHLLKKLEEIECKAVAAACNENIDCKAIVAACKEKRKILFIPFRSESVSNHYLIEFGIQSTEELLSNIYYQLTFYYNHERLNKQTKPMYYNSDYKILCENVMKYSENLLKRLKDDVTMQSDDIFSIFLKFFALFDIILILSEDFRTEKRDEILLQICLKKIDELFFENNPYKAAQIFDEIDKILTRTKEVIENKFVFQSLKIRNIEVNTVFSDIRTLLEKVKKFEYFTDEEMNVIREHVLAYEAVEANKNLPSMEGKLTKRYIEKKYYWDPIHKIRFPKSIEEKIFSLLIQKVNFLLERIKLLKGILIDEDEEIKQNWENRDDESLQIHTKCLMVRRYIYDMETRASLEMLFLDCLNILNRKDLKDLWRKATDLYSGINLRDVLSHGNYLLETVGDLLHPHDLPCQLIDKMLELIEDAESINKMLLLCKGSSIETKKDLKEIIENSSKHEEVILSAEIKKCPRWKSYIFLMCLQ